VKTFKINTTTVIDLPNINLAIGNFDGVHVGHQKIISQLVEHSRNNKNKSAILSFAPHPRQYFSNIYENFCIVDEKEKIRLLKNLNVDYYFSLQFDKSLADYSAEDFVKIILYKKLNIKHLTVGYDFKFGKDRKGNLDLLKKLSSQYNFTISVVNQVTNNISEIYSSSLVRKNIQEGNFEKVSSLLLRNWNMRGKVIKGEQRARKINFPTANIKPDKLIKPKKGVYTIKALFEEKYYCGIANFGERPTVAGNTLLLEVHLFDFDQDIYGKELTVEFLTFIRDEKKFDNFDILTEQIQKDIEIAKKYHRVK
tara:strand:- start:149 stop:1078 length:930 start_codon:yes stop_codon:yes gene_type:complete